MPIVGLDRVLDVGSVDKTGDLGLDLIGALPKALRLGLTGRGLASRSLAEPRGVFGAPLAREVVALDPIDGLARLGASCSAPEASVSASSTRASHVCE